MIHHFHGAAAMAHGRRDDLAFWLAGGVVSGWFFYMKRPDIPAAIKNALPGALYHPRQQVPLRQVQRACLCRRCAHGPGFGRLGSGDVAMIDGLINGSARAVGWFAGHPLLPDWSIYGYAFTMIIGGGRAADPSGSSAPKRTKRGTLMSGPLRACDLDTDRRCRLLTLLAFDRNAPLAHAGTRFGPDPRFLVTIPLWTGFDSAPAVCDAVCRTESLDSEPSTSTTTSASMASRCCLS